jgi:glutamine amidotransferase
MRVTTVVDYGIVNLRNILRGLKHVGAKVEVTHDPERLLKAERVILPGVGAFAAGMAELGSRNLDQALIEVAAVGRPVLGICLGMQMLLETSTENGRHQGLGLIPGDVIPIPKEGDNTSERRRKVPHIGWNALDYPSHMTTWRNTCLNATSQGAFFYFVHSFMAALESTTYVLAQCNYEDLPIVAAIAKDNITGLQFHPERSGPEGLQILKTFVSG